MGGLRVFGGAQFVACAPLAAQTARKMIPSRQIRGEPISTTCVSRNPPDNHSRLLRNLSRYGGRELKARDSGSVRRRLCTARPCGGCATGGKRSTDNDVAANVYLRLPPNCGRLGLTRTRASNRADRGSSRKPGTARTAGMDTGRDRGKGDTRLRQQPSRTRCEQPCGAPRRRTKVV